MDIGCGRDSLMRNVDEKCLVNECNEIMIAATVVSINVRLNFMVCVLRFDLYVVGLDIR